MTRRILIAIGLGLGLLLAVVLVRTMLHTPEAFESAPLEVIEFDDQVAARHLAEAVRFETVSHQSGARYPG